MGEKCGIITPETFPAKGRQACPWKLWAVSDGIETLYPSHYRKDRM